MSVERHRPKKKVAAELLARREFETVRVVGYVGSCVSHDPEGRGKVQAWATEDQYLMPTVCRTEDQYEDALAYATRQANKAHARTKCTHTLVVTLNIS